MFQSRCGDAVITLLCGAGMFQPPSIATKLDPQPSILTRDAPYKPKLNDQSVCNWSGWESLFWPTTLALRGTGVQAFFFTILIAASLSLCSSV